MQKKVKIAVMAFCYSPLVFAQNVNSENQAKALDENAFTFAEAQLGEDDNITLKAYRLEIGEGDGVGYTAVEHFLTFELHHL